MVNAAHHALLIWQGSEDDGKLAFGFGDDFGIGHLKCR